MPQSTKFNIRHLKFIEGVVEGLSLKQAYVDAGYKDGSTVYSNAHMLSIEPKIAAEIERRRQLLHDQILRKLEKLAEKSVRVYDELLDSAKETKERVAIAKDILDRVGFKPREQVEVASDITIKHSYPEAPNE